MTLVLIIAESNRLPDNTRNPACACSARDTGRITFSFRLAIRHVLGDRATCDVSAALQAPRLQQRVHHRGNAAGSMKVFTQQFARRFQIHQQGNIVPFRFPCLDREIDADMARDRRHVRWAVG